MKLAFVFVTLKGCDKYGIERVWAESDSSIAKEGDPVGGVVRVHFLIGLCRTKNAMR
jgi:hypothetical protein